MENNKEIYDVNVINVIINIMEIVNKVNGSNLKIKVIFIRNLMIIYINYNSLKNVLRKDDMNKIDYLVESFKRIIINNIIKIIDNYVLKEGYIKSKFMMVIFVGCKYYNFDINVIVNCVI